MALTANEVEWQTNEIVKYLLDDSGDCSYRQFGLIEADSGHGKRWFLLCSINVHGLCVGVTLATVPLTSFEDACKLCQKQRRSQGHMLNIYPI